MKTRQRSPNYPSTPLHEAIDLVGKIHKIERTNPTDRAVAAKAMGYSGISGRSAKVLSNLIQYGLLEKSGKNEVRVTKRAVEILHPESPESRIAALRDAAFEPELFQRVNNRFPDGRPSAAGLRSYFVREEFTDAAIPSAIRAYLETYQFLEDVNAIESHGPSPDEVSESHDDQTLGEGDDMRSSELQRHTGKKPPATHAPAPAQTTTVGPSFQWADKKIWLGGVVSDRQEADDLIAFITALRPFLQEPQSEAEDEADEGEPGSESDD